MACVLRVPPPVTEIVPPPSLRNSALAVLINCPRSSLAFAVTTFSGCDGGGPPYDAKSIRGVGCGVGGTQTRVPAEAVRLAAGLFDVDLPGSKYSRRNASLYAFKSSIALGVRAPFLSTSERPASIAAR